MPHPTPCRGPVVHHMDSSNANNTHCRPSKMLNYLCLFICIGSCSLSVWALPNSLFPQVLHVVHQGPCRTSRRPSSGQVSKESLPDSLLSLLPYTPPQSSLLPDFCSCPLAGIPLRKAGRFANPLLMSLAVFCPLPSMGQLHSDTTLNSKAGPLKAAVPQGQGRPECHWTMTCCLTQIQSTMTPAKLFNDLTG